MRTSEQLNEIAPALAKAQSFVRPASRDRENAAFKQNGKASRYADLSSVWEACRQAVTDAGLTVLQEVTGTEDGVAITTRLQHASGQWIEMGPTPIPLSKRDAQGTGSAISYGRRYALAAALGIVTDDDDDGAGASKDNRAAGDAQTTPLDKRTADWLFALTKKDTRDDVLALWADAAAKFRQPRDPEAHAVVKAAVEARIKELTSVSA